MSLFACGCIRQCLDPKHFGSESRGRLEIYMCLAAPFDDSQIVESTKVSIKSSFMEIVFSLCIQQK